MRFNNRFFLALLAAFITLITDKSSVNGLPLPRPAAKVEVSVPKPLKARAAEADDREDHMLALRDYMSNVQNLGGSPYGRSLLRRTMPVADKVAMPTQLKASSSGFIFLPVVGGGQASASSSSSASASNGQEKVGAAPIRQTMFINIEAPSGGQLAQVNIPDAKKDDPCPEDKNTAAGADLAAAGGFANGQGTDKQDDKAQDPNQKGNDTGAGQGGAGADATPAGQPGDQGQGGQDNTKADDAKTPPPANDAKTAPPADDAKTGAATLATNANGIPAVTPTAKTALKAPAGIDESKKTKVVFKPLSDPDPVTPPADKNAAATPPPPPPSPPSADSKAALPAPALQGPDLGNTGAVPDNADDKKPDPKASAGGVQSGAAATSTQQTTTPQDPAINPASIPLDLGINTPASLAATNATTTASAPPANTANSAAGAGGSNKDYFIYPVEQDDKLVDLKKGDMVAYVDKSGNLSNDGGSQAVKQMLGGGGAPPATTQSAANLNPAGTPLPLIKRTHPRMFTLERRELLEKQGIAEKQAIPRKKREEGGKKKEGESIWSWSTSHASLTGQSPDRL